MEDTVGMVGKDSEKVSSPSFCQSFPPAASLPPKQAKKGHMTADRWLHLTEPPLPHLKSGEESTLSEDS